MYCRIRQTVYTCIPQCTCTCILPQCTCTCIYYPSVHVHVYYPSVHVHLLIIPLCLFVCLSYISWTSSTWHWEREREKEGGEGRREKVNSIILYRIAVIVLFLIKGFINPLIRNKTITAILLLHCILSKNCVS